MTPMRPNAPVEALLADLVGLLKVAIGKFDALNTGSSDLP
jgi:hypothetical protein